jgi:hypothetical protein
LYQFLFAGNPVFVIPTLYVIIILAHIVRMGEKQPIASQQSPLHPGLPGKR